MRTTRRIILYTFITLLIMNLIPINALAFDNSGWYWPVPDSLSLSRGYYSGHEGIDIKTFRDVNETVVAARAGTVIAVYEGCTQWDGYGKSHSGCNPVAHLTSGDKWGIRWYQEDGGTDVCNYGIGNGVVIDHGSGVWTEYSHMASVNVSVGQYVNGGDKIGTMGSYGNSTGRHLHFSIRTDAYMSSGGYPHGNAVNTNPYGEEYIIYGSWNQVDNIWYSRDYPPSQTILDVNGNLDGVDLGDLEGFGACDVYINGSLASRNVRDYCEGLPVGTTYRVTNIIAANGYSYTGQSEYSGTVGTTRVNISLRFTTKKPTAISIPDTLTVQAGGTGTLTATLAPSDLLSSVKGVTWTSSNTSVATVTSSGVVTGVAEGTATITATASANTSIAASCVVTVTRAIPTPEITGIDVDGYNVHLAWSASEPVDANDVRAYDISIYRDPGDSDIPENSFEGITETYCDFTVSGPGDYRAVVKAVNTATGVSSAGASMIFTVDWVITGEWQTSSSLPSNVTPETCDIEYRHTYRTTAQSSPGTGWTQVPGSAVTTYTKPGGEYEDVTIYESTNTRRLVRYYYYHFCGPSTGDVADYYQHDGYVHWDQIDPSRVSVLKSGDDPENPAYQWYVLLWPDGSEVYCESGTTCDGSYGSHGQRSKAWYRMNVYQNYIGTTIYTWTKTGDWETTQDDEAYSTLYRFRLKDSAAPVIESVSVTAVTPRDYTVSCGVSDDTGIAKVVFAAWTDDETEAEAAVQEFVADGSAKEAEFSATFAATDHGNARDVYYNTKVCVYDVRGNVAEYTGDDIHVFVPMVLHSSKKMALPAGLQEVADMAFEGDIRIAEVILPDGVVSIGSRAFADCGRLTVVYVPDSVQTIANDAFDESGNVVLICGVDSAAAAFAKANHVPYVTGE